MEREKALIAISCVAALVGAGSVAAETTYGNGGDAAKTASTQAVARGTTDANDEARGAAKDIDEAVVVIRRMEADPSTAELLRSAKGVFVVPKYGRVAVGIGGRGGVGLLMIRHDDGWSDPAFYNFGGMSAGAQFGAEGGSFVLVMNNDKAVNTFARRNNWSLDANAGLTVVKWSKAAESKAGKGDVTLWSNAKGLFGGVAVRVTDIKFDADQTSAYYGRNVAVDDVLTGKVSKAQTDALKQALASAERTAATRSATTAVASRHESASAK